MLSILLTLCLVISLSSFAVYGEPSETALETSETEVALSGEEDIREEAAQLKEAPDQEEAAELWESAGVQEEAAPAENEAETSKETVLSENEAGTSEEAVLSENEAETSEEAVLSENEAMIPEETVATGYETETQDEMITSEEEAVTEDTVGRGALEGVGHAVSDLGTSDIEKTTYSLRLDSDTSIYTYFKPVSGYTGSFSAKVYKGDVKVSCKVKKQSDGRYRVIIPSIPAYNLSDSYTIKATTDNGTATYTVSPYTYANDLMTKYPEDPIVIKAMVSLYYYAQKAWTCKYGIGVN